MDSQQLLLFDIEQLDKKNNLVPDWDKLPFNGKPVNDIDRLVDCQWRFRHGDEHAVQEMFPLIIRVSMKMQSALVGGKLSRCEKLEVAEETAAAIVSRFLMRDKSKSPKKMYFMIKDFYQYINRETKHWLYYSQNDALDHVVNSDIFDCDIKACIS